MQCWKCNGRGKILYGLIVTPKKAIERYIPCPVCQAVKNARKSYKIKLTRCKGESK